MNGHSELRYALQLLFIHSKGTLCVCSLLQVNSCNFMNNNGVISIMIWINIYRKHSALFVFSLYDQRLNIQIPIEFIISNGTV